MTQLKTAFPLSGVIGIVDSSVSQLDLAQQYGLRCVEIRADLLATTAGMPNNEVLTLIKTAKADGLACLYTLRHADQGGTFTGSEDERVERCTQALKAGADIIDLEHGTNSAKAMLENSVPMILSYHNFRRMIDAAELAELSDAMEAQAPLAVKIIPTGQSMGDAAQMMSWVGDAGGDIKRIGFAMGPDGATSRILGLTRGCPVTYASFGEPVAPGQVDINLLVERYQCMNMSTDTVVEALIGDDASVEKYIAAEQGKQPSTVFIGFPKAQRAQVEQHQRALNIRDSVVL